MSSLPPTAELRRLLRAGAPLYVLVDPVEYHGPHLTLLNDHHVAMGVAADLHRRLCEELGDHPLLIAPELGVGVDPVPGPGSEATPFRVVRRRVVEAVERWIALGAQRLVLLTFHGSPMHAHALQAGVVAARRRGVAALAPLHLALTQLASGELKGVDDAWLPIQGEAEREALRLGVAHDFHAGFLETSLALHYAPEHVHGHRDVAPVAPWTPHRGAAAAARWAQRLGAQQLGVELELVAHGLGWYAADGFVGYTGRPHLANPDSGAVFAHALVKGFVEATLDVFEGGEPPEPMLSWLPAATLDGRVARSAAVFA